jgi:hypothetical protein
MGVYPTQYNKESFKVFLIKNNVGGEIIEKFDGLPEKIISKGNTYDIYINSIWYSVGNTFYNFELNYYCEDKIEYLFNSRVFSDIEISIDVLLLELKKFNKNTK